MRRRFANAAATLAVVAALAVPAAARAEMRKVAVGEGFDGGSVRLGVGDELTVDLPAPEGKAWTVAFRDPAILKPAAAAGEPARRFTAAAAGSTSLGLVLRKAGGPPAAVFRVAVEVLASAPPRRSLALSEVDDGSELFLMKGDVLTVRLPSNVTTGYGWTVAQAAPGVLQSPENPVY